MTKKITNESLTRSEQAKMEIEIGCLNLLKDRIRSPFTIENVFRFRDSPRWELEGELSKARKECKGHLKHLLPAVEAEIKQGYNDEYFEQIAKCFSDAPRGLRVEDIKLKDGVLSYTEPYKQARLASATLDLTEEETELLVAISTARTAIEKLRDLGVGKRSSEDLKWILFDTNPTEEIAYHYVQAERRRSKFINL